MVLSDTTGELGTSLKELGGGLVMRRGTLEDAEPLAEFQAITNSNTEEPDEGIRHWTLDLAKGSMPGFAPSDFVIVEDTTTGAIVSSLNLISQTWSYDGLEFGVGRIELVATHPDFRRRGLVRAQMDVVHEWSSARGEMVQGITGIPWYYRQFGYEMTIESSGGFLWKVPDAADKWLRKNPAFTLRPAEPDDLTLASRLYRRGTERYLVSCVRSEEMWRYELNGRSERSAHRHEIRVIEDREGMLVGCLIHAPALSRRKLVITLLELDSDTSWEAVMPAVASYTREVGLEYAARDGGDFEGVLLSLNSDHPVYEVSDLTLRPEHPYAWYLRVPDLPMFVSRITPVLDDNLAKSHAAGYSGELKISFVGHGLFLVFKNGKVTAADRWIPTQLDSRLIPRVRDALFPDLTFLQLLFGFRSVEDLEYAFPDCRISSNDVRMLLNILFPRRASHIWGIE